MVNVLVKTWHPPEAKDVPLRTDWGGNKVESQATASAGDGVGNQQLGLLLVGMQMVWPPWKTAQFLQGLNTACEL